MQVASDHSLAQGLSGQALALKMLERIGLGSFEGEIHAGLERAFDLAQERPGGLGLFHGLAGLTWALSECNSFQCYQEDIDNLVEFLHEALGDISLPAELVGGLAGLGMLCLRLASSSPKALALQSTVLEKLESLSRRDEDGVLWPAARKDRLWEVDLGIAHGAVGIASYLSMVSAHFPNDEKARHLRDESWRWLEKKLGNQPAPAVLRTEGTCEEGPVGWCYSSLGTAAIMHCSPAPSPTPAWERLRDGQTSAALDPAFERQAPEQGICHGVASATLLNYRLFLSTGEETFGSRARRGAEACVELLERGLDEDRDCGLLLGLGGIQCGAAPTARSALPRRQDARPARLERHPRRVKDQDSGAVLGPVHRRRRGRRHRRSHRHWQVAPGRRSRRRGRPATDSCALHPRRRPRP